MSWANLENASIILDLVTYAWKAGATGFTGVAGFHLLRDYLTDTGSLANRVIKRWRRILRTLTDEQKAILEAEKPGVVVDMERRLDTLEQELAVLHVALESNTRFGIIWPRTHNAKRVNDVIKFAKKLEDDFTETTGRILQSQEVVEAVIEADRAATANIAHMEMSPLPGSWPVPGDVDTSPTPGAIPSAPDANAHMAPELQSPPTAVTAPVHIPAEVATAYRSAVATTAALLPALIRGGSRRPSHMSPV